MRAEIKAYAREAVALQRGTWILFVIVFGLSCAAATGVGFLFINIPLIGWLIPIGAYLVIFVMNVNICGFAIRSFKKEDISVSEPFSELRVGFFRKLGGMLWMTLWVFMWSLIPFAGSILGIIKGYEYSMAPYILADCPNVTATEALNLSKRITDGYKGELLVLSLSWIGWWLLSALTFGIVAVVHVIPYSYTTEAGFYIRLRDQAIAFGRVTAFELGMEQG